MERIRKRLIGSMIILGLSLCLTGCGNDDQFDVSDRIEDRVENDLDDRIEDKIEDKVDANEKTEWDDKIDLDIEIESDMQNVEQRDYATVLLVSNGKNDEDYTFSLGIAKEKKVGEKSQNEELVTFLADDIEDLYEKYWSVKGKSLSLVHLKAIVMEKPEGQTIGYLWDFLDDLEESPDIAKTCPVIQVADKEAFTKYVKDADEPVGTYLSDLVKVNEEQGKTIPQVKDYLKVLREGTSLQIYFLEEEEEGWKLVCRDEIGI